MAYIQQTGAVPLSVEQLEALARLAGVPLLPEDIDPLRSALADQLASIALLDKLDLTAVNPSLEFDPRWPEAGD